MRSSYVRSIQVLKLYLATTGPEVTAEAVKVLQTVASKSGDVTFNIQSHDFGGIAIDNHGNPLPDSTLEACRKSDAILLGGSQILKLLARVCS